MSRAAIDAEIAITAPTERSTPPVATTRVMPIASSMTVAPLPQDVDEIAVQMAVDDREPEEARVEDQVEQQDRPRGR